MSTPRKGSRSARPSYRASGFTIGIDPNKNGGFAVLDVARALLDCWPMPVSAGAVSFTGIGFLLSHIAERYAGALVVVERQRPILRRQRDKTIPLLGTAIAVENYGRLKAMLSMAGFADLVEYEPLHWQARFAVPSLALVEAQARGRRARFQFRRRVAERIAEQVWPAAPAMYTERWTPGTAQAALIAYQHIALVEATRPPEVKRG